LDFLTLNNAVLGSGMRLYGSKGLSVNNTTDPGAGNISANTAFRIGTSVGTSGKILQNNGTDGFVASTPMWPTTAGTANKVVKSNGTDLVMSTETYAAPGSLGNISLSDGTNWTSYAAAPTFSQNTPAQSITAATDTYITNSGLSVPSTLRVGTRFRWYINVTKTAAGAASPVWSFRWGTSASTADTARVTITGSAQSAAVDTKTFVWDSIVLTTGASGTIRVFQSGLMTATSQGVPVGLGGATSTNTNWRGVSSTFDTTVGASSIGISVNTGTAAAWTINSVDTEIIP
jgi:hypothetical protein